MTIESLKSSIEDKTYSGELVVFVTGGNTFIPYQYVTRMSELRKRPIRLIDDIHQVIKSKFDIFDIEDESEYFNVLNVDDFNCAEVSVLNIKDAVIVAKTVKDLATQQVFSDKIITVTKLEPWQIKEYVYSKAQGVATSKLDWLMSICKNDIFRLDQELAKINVFSEPERKFVFDDFVEDGVFDDLSSLSVFNLINAIVTKDMVKLKEVYQDIDNIDVSEFGFITLLYSNFRNIISIQLGNNPTPEKLGLSAKQFSAIRYNCGRYTASQLTDIFQFICSLDMKIKTGQLPTDILVDYIIQKILSY